MEGSTPARLSVEGPRVSGVDAGAGYAVAGSILVMLAASLGAMTSSRSRRVLLGAAVAGSAGSVVASIYAIANAGARARSAFEIASPSLKALPVAVTLLGALAAAASSVAAFSAGRSAVAVQMPEGAPRIEADDIDD